MARKITLSIPDMLHEKMEEWRQSFNLSKMFQDALSEAISRREEFQRRIHEDQSMAETIERLKKEKKLSEGNYAEKGKLAGFMWAKSAHYDDPLYALELKTSPDMIHDERMGNYFSELLHQDHLMDYAIDPPNKYGRLFLRGWRKGLAEFWNAVKEKL